VGLVEVLLGAGADDAPALVGRRGVTSYSELRDLAARVGALLGGGGIVPGDRVAIVSPNDESFVAAYLAALHVGAIAVPVNPQAPPAELERELSSVQPRVALGVGPAAAMAKAAGAGVITLDLDVLPPTGAPRVERADDDPAVLLFTSGTAGAPKAATLTHRSLTANIRQVLDHPGLHIGASDVTFGALPFFHIFGLNVVLGVALAAGASTVLVEHFDAADTAALVGARGVTVVAGVPTMFSQWLDLSADEAGPDTFKRVRLAVSGAAALAPEVATGFRERWGVVLHQGYGLTEASPIVTTTAIRADAPRPGSIGPPLPGVEVRLVDDDGSEVLVGDPGEIQVRGPNVFAGYWHDDEATAAARTSDGWLRTGDVAVVDEDGELWLVDRAKDLVIVSGFNVFPAEVEDVLRAHPQVADVAVVGEPSTRTGEAVVAYVVPEPAESVALDDLAAHCAHALARYKCPSRYEIVDALPRSAAGKLVRRSVRDASATRNPA
jgi:long-chain acyl-CoA synthetase